MIEHLLCFAVGSGWGMVPEQWGSESLGCGWSSRVKRGWAAFDLETTQKVHVHCHHLGPPKASGKATGSEMSLRNGRDSAHDWLVSSHFWPAQRQIDVDAWIADVLDPPWSAWWM